MKVKAIRDGFYVLSKKRKGSVFQIKDLSHFSHLWMKAIDFEPTAPSEQIAKIMDGPEFISKFAKYNPADRTTHAMDGQTADPHDDVEVEEQNAEEVIEAPKPKHGPQSGQQQGKKPSQQQVI